MNRIEVDPAKAFEAIKKIPEGEQLFMLNMLRFNERANYRSEDDQAENLTGREAYYKKYAPAFMKAAEGEDVKVFWAGGVIAQFVAEDDENWDEIAIVRYKDVATFRRITENKIYREEAEEHRIAALKDWRLIAMSERDLTK